MADLADTHRSPVTPGEDLRTIALHQISWGAVIAGVSIALILQLILNLLGLGLGLTSVSVTEGDNPAASSASIAAGLWWVVSGVIAAAAGGYTAGRLSGKPVESSAGYHGLISWAVTTFVVIYLLSSALGGLVGGAFSTVSSALGGAAQSVGGAAQTAIQAAGPSLPNLPNPFSAIGARSAAPRGGRIRLRCATRRSRPCAMRSPAIPRSSRRPATRLPTHSPRRRASRSIRPRRRSRQYQDQYAKTVADAKEKAKQSAETARKAAAQGALYGALALLIGAGGGLSAGRAGAVNPTLTGIGSARRV